MSDEQNMSNPRKRWMIVGGAVVVALAVIAAGVVYLFPGLGKTTITAEFPSTTGLYAGDDVRVLGVKVGTIESIDPNGTGATVVMNVDRSVEIPADAKAVIMAPSLVAARFVQLTPVYTGGETMADGGEIPIGRTAVPVEWDEIKTELTKLSDALGPQGGADQGSLGTFIDTVGANLDGNGDALRNTLRELSDTMKTLSDGRTDLFGTIRNLQTFVSALSASNQQIVQFGGRLHSVSSLLADTSDELGTALQDLDVAIGDVNRFVTENRDSLTEQVGRLADATSVLVEKRPELEMVLHVAPTALANFYNIYSPKQGSLNGAFAASNARNPINMVCGLIAGLETNDSDRSSDLCAQYLGPVLNSIATNYPGIMTNPAIGAGARPDQIVFSPPSLASEVPPRSAPTTIAGPLAAMPTVAVPKDLGALLNPGGGR
ncbi:MCE family protein [Prescottella agglutinans]|uniref:Phospholipid/cholesterol/gamma-HCH transport system substrate-binding protein n=1 Tax=Prescottella agglutinans TaxID=1644129 RepID=A0ABT6MJJ2_9NOCA|nr:MCE family protein [Prescottella agglutinans]MDH6284483.1 phospholipid/cholesterol/gamma-HCH transport system substrate-binding protein [Prescottella agglutinans]